MDNVIHPTHTCFDDALDLLVDLMRQAKSHTQGKRLVRRYRLVHAICSAEAGQPAGKPFAHAWVEDLEKDQVLFIGLLRGEKHIVAADREEYQHNIGLEHAIRYSYPEAVVWNRITRHYGPWDQQVRALCRTSNQEQSQ
jgi:hypothetical protein